MTISRYLAIYVNRHGAPAAVMLNDQTGANLPAGVDEFSLGLPDYDGEPVTLVGMPADDFRPVVHDVETDTELALSFIDLPEVLEAPDED